MSRKKFSSEKNILIGKNISLIRKDKSLTVDSFAKRLNFSKGFVSEIESGKKMPGGQFFSSLKQIFNININWLLTGQGEMYAKMPGHETDSPILVSPTLKKIVDVLVTMDDDLHRDVLKYIEEKKLLTDLLKERMMKEEQQEAKKKAS